MQYEELILVLETLSILLMVCVGISYKLYPTSDMIRMGVKYRSKNCLNKL